MYEIRYRLEQLDNTAQYIWAQNPHCSQWPEPCFSVAQVKNYILKRLLDQAALNMACYDTGPWTDCIGGPGYWLIFSSENENSIEVEILVDMALRNTRFSYVTHVIE